MTTPNSGNLYLGAGEVFLDRFDNAGLPTGMRHLGNVDSFTTTSTVDNVEKKSSMSGVRATLAQVPKGFKAEIGLEMSEWDPKNISLVMLGTDGSYTQAADAAITARALAPAAFAFDTWYEFKDANGNPVVNPVVTALKQAAVTLNALGYEVRAEAGMVRFLSSYTGAGKAVAGSAITWDGSTPAIVAADNRTVVQALAVSKVKGRLRYISAPDQASGPRVLVDAWNCNLFPDGDISYIAEDFSQLKMKGEVLIDNTKPLGSQFIRVLYL